MCNSNIMPILVSWLSAITSVMVTVGFDTIANYSGPRSLKIFKGCVHTLFFTMLPLRHVSHDQLGRWVVELAGRWIFVINILIVMFT